MYYSISCLFEIINSVNLLGFIVFILIILGTIIVPTRLSTLNYLFHLLFR